MMGSRGRFACRTACMPPITLTNRSNPSDSRRLAAIELRYPLPHTTVRGALCGLPDVNSPAATVIRRSVASVARMITGGDFGLGNSAVDRASTAAEDYFLTPKTASFAALATRNFTTVLGGIFIFCCVWGLKPVRAFLFCFTIHRSF
jgi:hypothetical protein